MRLGRHRDESPGRTGGRVRASALVVATDMPLAAFDTLVPKGKVGRGTVRILVRDIAETPIYASGSFTLKRDRWLVRGMEIPIAIDPSDPDSFEIEWDGIPGIEERVAVNDPTLADPIGTRKRVIDVMRASGVWGPDLEKLPRGIGDLVARSEDASSEATPDRFAEAMQRAAHEPAPPGKARGVALIATTMTSIVTSGSPSDGLGSRRERTSAGRHDAVLAVNVPGRDPYAVFVHRFKRPSKKRDISGAGLPCLVSSADPKDVEVLWDEVPSAMDQVEQRIADGMGAAAAGIQEEMEIRKRMMGAVEQASSDPQAAPPAPAAGQMPQLAPGMQEMMAQNAKRALEFVKDPAMRKMLIQQYRAAGIEVDETDEAG